MNRKQLEASILEDLTVKRPKVKRKRKPMTPEQKAAAAERLAKAREKRQKANPPKYANVHASVLALPDDHPFSRKAVTDWIKHQKELLSEYRRQERMKMKGAPAKVANAVAYIRHCEWYLKNGDWIDSYYGKDADKKVRRRVIVPSKTTKYEYHDEEET